MGGVGAAIGIISAVVGTAASLNKASEAKRARQQAAEQAKRESEFEARRQRKLADQLISKQRAAYGASGALLEGTPFLVMSETEREVQEEINTILTLGGMRHEAGMQEADAMWDIGVGQAGASLLQGASTIASSDYFNPKKNKE